MKRRNKDIVASTRDRLGRTIVLEQERWQHIIDYVDRDLDGRPQAIMRAVENADKRLAGNRPGTEKIIAEKLGPARWLAVVVEYDGLYGRVITAIPLTKEPKADE